MMNDEQDPFKGLEDDDVQYDLVQTLAADLSNLKERFADHIDADMSLSEYVDFDVKVSTSHSKLGNAEIIAKVNETQEDNSDDEESTNVEGEPIIKPGINVEHVHHVHMLYFLCLFTPLLIKTLMTPTLLGEMFGGKKRFCAIGLKC